MADVQPETVKAAAPAPGRSGFYPATGEQERAVAPDGRRRAGPLQPAAPPGHGCSGSEEALAASRVALRFPGRGSSGTARSLRFFRPRPLFPQPPALRRGFPGCRLPGCRLRGRGFLNVGSSARASSETGSSTAAPRLAAPPRPVLGTAPEPPVPRLACPQRLLGWRVLRTSSTGGSSETGVPRTPFPRSGFSPEFPWLELRPLRRLRDCGFPRRAAMSGSGSSSRAGSGR